MKTWAWILILLNIIIQLKPSGNYIEKDDEYTCVIKNDTDQTVWFAIRISQDSLLELHEEFLLPVYSFEYTTHLFQERYRSNSPYSGTSGVASTYVVGEDFSRYCDGLEPGMKPYFQQTSYHSDDYMVFELRPDSCAYTLYTRDTYYSKTPNLTTYTFFAIPFQDVIYDSRARILQNRKLKEIAKISQIELDKMIERVDTVYGKGAIRRGIHEETYMSFNGDSLVLENRIIGIPSSDDPKSRERATIIPIWLIYLCILLVAIFPF